MERTSNKYKKNTAPNFCIALLYTSAAGSFMAYTPYTQVKFQLKVN